MQAVESITQKCEPEGIAEFEYPAGANAPVLPDWCPLVTEEIHPLDPDPAAECDEPGNGIEDELRAEFDKRLADETRKAFESGRERGKQEGLQAEREAQAKTVAAEHARYARQLADVVEKFAQERDSYLRAVEPEVVKLSLAIAARILRREAQMDPLLLTGAVRVALGQLAGSTQMQLKVPPAELELWTEAIALLPKLAVKPTVLAGEGMRLGECVIETEMGSVDLGIRSQLGEIERGFFDRAVGGGSAADGASKETPEPGQENNA